MKNLSIYILLFVTSLFTISCEEVVDVNLNNSEPKLVIEAVIKWQKGTTGENQTIKLSLTNDFYTNDVLPANDAVVTITNSANVVFNFVQVPNTEDYACDNFQPVIGETYHLEVLYEGELYTATDVLYATPDIINVEQETVTGFGGDDQIQVKYFYQDNGAEENYYLLQVKNPNKQIPEFGVISDEFFQGNVMFGFYGSTETEPGITLDLSVQGVSKGYYNYMNKLITIAGSGSGNPFATPPATVRGNISNTTNNPNYPLGYFALGEVSTVEYLVQ
ncbi:DUF4249 domain-containing protein [Flavobacterium channae]|uniref:DUF4249 domain-containing protein n=1 Tax=Flavobacterium channae TaxID=2897181 RepID=UPI001E47DC4A|nr:DUF4249 domain-containing protein [Flavobacterium channae]UGS22841.1 DUF4249 domain-containing protein [Flavobacterium channae]